MEKRKQSFAHSKRFAQYESAVHVGASRREGATEPRGSVWSARNLLPLWFVPRQHALANRQDWKAGKLFLFQVQCQWAGRSPISARSKIEMLPCCRSHSKRSGKRRAFIVISTDATAKSFSSSPCDFARFVRCDDVLLGGFRRFWGGRKRRTRTENLAHSLPPQHPRHSILRGLP